MNYQTQKTAELRKIAEEQNIKGSEEMERQALITALKGQDAEPVPEPEEKPEEEAEETPPVPEPEAEDEEDEPAPEPEKKPEEAPANIIVGFRGSRVAKGSKASRMKDKLDHQVKVKVMIPLEGDKFGSTMPITLNSYRMNVLKGIYVSVPMQVADIIMDSQKQTLQALEGPMRKFAQDGMPMKLDGEAPGALY